jgi:hypothetical protein
LHEDVVDDDRGGIYHLIFIINRTTHTCWLLLLYILTYLRMYMYFLCHHGPMKEAGWLTSFVVGTFGLQYVSAVHPPKILRVGQCDQITEEIKKKR